MRVSEDDLRAWTEQTSDRASTSVRLFSGGRHFYVDTHRDELLSGLQQRLGAACARQPLSVLRAAEYDWPQLRDGLCVHDMVAQAAARAPAARVGRL